MSTETQLQAPPSATGKYLVFALDPNQYAVPIQSVREIIAMHEVTPLPRMPRFVKGVINLRGKIIPVADLRVCLGLESSEPTPISCIVVADIVNEEDGTSTQIGCIVDAVCDVREIDGEQVQEPPRGGDDHHVRGLVRTDDVVVALLDFEVLLGDIALQTSHVA